MQQSIRSSFGATNNREKENREVISVNCPNCGERIETRHTFCVICGADLKAFLENKKASQTSDTVREKIHAAMTKPLGKQANPVKTADEAEKPIIPEGLQPNV